MPLGFELRDDFACIHAQFDDFQRHPAWNRSFLLGVPHAAETSGADHFQQPVTVDMGMLLMVFLLRQMQGFLILICLVMSWFVCRTAIPSRKSFLDTTPQGIVITTFPLQVGITLSHRSL
ncbi:MAG: hypothetical protein ACKVY0_07670 [Prosthecobacter sp.]|uniref:hypothetical protein n=1 Tax=Prosthecobacter sp. TaxID=1965333 RepID=UPI0038FE48F5